MLKKAGILLALLGIAFLLLLALTQRSEFRVRSAALLAASPQQVWSGLVAVAAWPQWWPGVEAVGASGKLGPGAGIELRLKGQPELSRAQVEVFAPPRALVWEGPGVLGSRAGTGLRLTQVDGACRLEIENYIRGPQAFLARLTGEEAFRRYQQAFLDSFARKLRRPLSGGEKD